MDVREYLDQVRIEASVKAVDMSDVKFNREVYRQHVDQSQEHQARSNMGVRCVGIYPSVCIICGTFHIFTYTPSKLLLRLKRYKGDTLSLYSLSVTLQRLVLLSPLCDCHLVGLLPVYGR